MTLLPTSFMSQANQLLEESGILRKLHGFNVVLKHTF